MDKQRARLILQCYKSGSAHEDSDLKEALRLARQDPELLAWFEEDQRLDEAIRVKVRNASGSAPEDLAQEIISGYQKQTFSRGRAWHWPLGIAASIALIIATCLILLKSPPEADEFLQFRTEMASFLKEFPKLDFYTEKQADIRQWLAARQDFSTITIPSVLEKFPTIGCREFSWRGKKAVLVCFMVDGEVIHLFALPMSEWKVLAATSAQSFRVGRHHTAAWVQGNTAYLALSPGSEDFLRKSLAL